MIDIIRSTNDGPTVVVVGDESAKAVADHLHEEYDVTFLSDDDSVVRTAETVGIEAYQVDPTAAGELRAHAEGADAAVVGASRDRVTLLAAQLLRNACGIGSVVVQVNDPENRELFEDLDVQPLDSQELLAPEVERALVDLDDA